MIGLLIKLILTLGSLGYSAYSFVDGDWGTGIVMILLCSMVVLTIFKNEWIIMSLLQMRKQDTEKAAHYLAKIKQPQFLIKRQRAYYYYLTALAGQATKSMTETESLLKKALNIGLKQDQDKAVAKMNLAAIAMSKGRRKEADILLIDAKKLDKGKVLSSHIKELRSQMGRATSANQMRMARMNKGRRM